MRGGVLAALLGSVVVSAFDNEKRIKEIYDAEPALHPYESPSEAGAW